MEGVSLIIPALNEEMAIGQVIDRATESLRKSNRNFEIIVIDDGSIDKTLEIAKSKGVTVIRHPARGGYGLSIRDGIFRSKYNYLAIIDADGSYPAHEIPKLVDYLDGFDMVVGARTGKFYFQSFYNYVIRKIFQMLCEFVTGLKVPDANSGLRAFRKEKILNFKDKFCLGFSFTTTTTLAFHLNGYFVKYVPIEYHKRHGKSHVRFIKDTLTAIQIITQAILYYNPIKLFLLPTIFFLFLSALGLMYSFSKESLVVLMTSQSFLILGFLFLGFGFIADVLRQKREPF